MIEEDDQVPNQDAGPFPRWANYLLPASVIIVVGGVFYVPFLVGLAASPKTSDVGYAPVQPIPFSHRLHVGELGMDCRFCHTNIDTAAVASLPTTETCMSCHASVTPDSPLLAPLRESYESGMPISWRKVHDLPDHAYFNHAAHINKGIGCNTCHGPVHEMEVVQQAKTLSMASCLECHRNPEAYIRPREAVTWMDWDSLKATGKPQLQLGAELVEEYRVELGASIESCSKCHR